MYIAFPMQVFLVTSILIIFVCHHFPSYGQMHDGIHENEGAK